MPFVNSTLLLDEDSYYGCFLSDPLNAVMMAS